MKRPDVLLTAGCAGVEQLVQRLTATLRTIECLPRAVIVADVDRSVAAVARR